MLPPPAIRAKSAMAEPKWKLKVEQLMACNCNWGCPCSFDAPPTYGRCETALAYRIAKGSYGGVALDGLRFILVAAWPKAIHLGHGRGVLFLDAQATGPKREAIATAEAGGPMNIYMSMMTDRRRPGRRASNSGSSANGAGSAPGTGSAWNSNRCRI